MKDGYYTIPLHDKKSYTVANAVGHDRSFSIQAYAYDAWANKMTGKAFTREDIQQALSDEASFKVRSSTGKVYVNIGYPKAGGVSDVTHGMGGTVMVVKGVLNLASMLYSSATQATEYQFSITARETPTTRLQTTGEVTFGWIAGNLDYDHLWDIPIGSTAKVIRGGNDVRENTMTAFGVFSSAFKYFTR